MAYDEHEILGKLPDVQPAMGRICTALLACLTLAVLVSCQRLTPVTRIPSQEIAALLPGGTTIEESAYPTWTATAGRKSWRRRKSGPLMGENSQPSWRRREQKVVSPACFRIG